VFYFKYVNDSLPVLFVRMLQRLLAAGTLRPAARRFVLSLALTAHSKPYLSYYRSVAGPSAPWQSGSL